MSVQALSLAFATKGLSPSEKLVLLALSNYANAEMQCWPSQEKLAEDTELSARTVWTAIKVLTERGIIVREARRRMDGSRSSDIFTLNFVALDQPEQLANSAKPTRKLCEDKSQSLQEQVATVASLTTYEPSRNLGGGVGANDWPDCRIAERLADEVESPFLDPAKTPSLITSAGTIASWRTVGASWSEDVVPVVRAVMAIHGRPVSSWKFFDRAVLQSVADRTRTPELPQARTTGPPGLRSITDQLGHEQAEARRLAFEKMDARNG